jgi:hypothetical protein
MRRIVAIFSLFALPVLSDEAPRRQGDAGRVWEWTAEARLADRFDPAASRTRLARAVKAGDVSSASGEVVVIGRENPELLLGFELMDHLTIAFDSNPRKRRNARERIAGRTASLRLSDDFWERLEPLVQPFLDSWMEQKRVQQRLATAIGSELEWLKHENQRLENLGCSSRAQALAAARNEFGRETFDRFLYEGVAPDAIVIMTPGDASESLRWLEGGCQ